MKIIIRDHVRYNGVSYKILNYARFKSRIKDGTFSVNDYITFCSKMFKPSDVQRAVGTLVRYGHLRKLKNGRIAYVNTKVLTKLDVAYRQTMWNNTINKNKEENDD